MELAKHQLSALERMHNGCILYGTVGSGKTRTSLAYFYLKVCKGDMRINNTGHYIPMKEPKNLYIITTAQKRDKKEWEMELYDFPINNDISVNIDSWQNIKKYSDISNSFFIFDEQRVVGSGTWVKAFLKICRKNQWILLSATPGDKWKDYIPVFIANGFYINKTDFQRQHMMFDPFVTKYPKFIGYKNEGILIKRRNEILVIMKDLRHTERHIKEILVEYDKEKYKQAIKKRWDPYDNEPIAEIAKLCFVLRHIVNSDHSRMDKVLDLINAHNKVIIFYNYDFELYIIKNALAANQIPFKEWNGHRHDKLPNGNLWAYIVQYTSGSDGWNCTECDTVIFYSLNYSYKTMIQAMGRIDRMNTKYTDLYYYKFVSTSTIDKSIKRALDNGQIFNESAFLEAKNFMKKQK